MTTPVRGVGERLPSAPYIPGKREPEPHVRAGPRLVFVRPPCPQMPPREWHTAFKDTELVRWARRRKRIPYRIRDVGCWPFGDSTFGHWVGLLAYRGFLNVTLVNTPLWLSHHPYASSRAVDRADGLLVLHGLKDNDTSPYYLKAKAASGRPYQLAPRQCDTCSRLGWVTWPGSPMKEWRCCGERIQRKPRHLWPRTVAEGIVLTDKALGGLARKVLTHRMNASQINSLARQMFGSRTESERKAHAAGPEARPGAAAGDAGGDKHAA